MSRIGIIFFLFAFRISRGKFLLFLPDEFFNEIERGVHAKRDRSATDAVLPIVSIGIPCLGRNDAAGICADDAGKAEYTSAVYIAGSDRRDQCIFDTRTDARIFAAVIMAVELECLFEPVLRGALNDGLACAGGETLAKTFPMWAPFFG